jgi:hypothetical protein
MILSWKPLILKRVIVALRNEIESADAPLHGKLF